MTQYPGPNYPAQIPGYQSPYTRSAPVRPTSVTVLAIIGIIFGGLGVLCKPLGVAALFIPQPGPNPVIDMQRTMMVWNVANAVVGTLVSVLLLASSIGSLSLKPWARKGMLAYAGLALVLTVVNGVVTMIWVMPKMQEAQRQMLAQQSARGAPAPPPGMMNVMQTAGNAGAVIGLVLALIFPIVLMYFYTRPEVKAAFGDGGGAAPPYGGAPPAGGGYYPGQPPQPPVG